MNAEAKNFAAIKAARDEHDSGGCPYKSPASAIAMHPVDIERMNWEEGDSIAGLTLVADATVGTGSFWILCDGDPRMPEENVVSTGHEREKELTHA